MTRGTAQVLRGANIRVSRVLAFLCAAGVAGCASTPSKPSPSATGQVQEPAKTAQPTANGDFGPQELFGPPEPPSVDTPVPYGPEPVSVRPVVLVFGPGMARGFAYVGAIRALTEAKIPIGAILGTEMGALVGSLYAMDAKINRFEWAILKFRDGAFESQGGLMPEVFQRSARLKKLDEGLEGVFEKKDLSQSKLPVKVAIQPKDSPAAIVDRGPATSVVRAAIADPEIFGPVQWNGQSAQSAARTRPLLVSEARAMKLGPVVVIDAMEPGDERKWVSSAELHEADLVIRPNLAGIGPMDFQKRTDAAFRGKSAVNKQIAEIRHLVGMPADPEPVKGSP